MPPDRRAGPRPRRPRHRPGRRDPRRFSRRARHGFRPGSGLSVRQAAGDQKVRPVAPANGIQPQLRDPRGAAGTYSNFMSMHFAMSEPSPDEMMMQPRTFGALLSLAHTA